MKNYLVSIGWEGEGFQWNVKYLPIVILIFTGAYFIIWLINYIIYKRSIRDINSDLDELRKREDGNTYLCSIWVFFRLENQMYS